MPDSYVSLEEFKSWRRNPLQFAIARAWFKATPEERKQAIQKAREHIGKLKFVRTQQSDSN